MLFLGAGMTTEFPSIARSDLVYFDAAAMAPHHQNTESLLSSPRFRTNVHRALYFEGEATDALFQQIRLEMSSLLGCSLDALSFCDRTTLGLNHLAFALEACDFSPKQPLWVSRLEHHANWLPWQRLAQKKGLTLVEIPLSKDTLLPDYDWMAQEQRVHPPMLVAVTHASNITGGVVDLLRIRRLLGDAPLMVVDGAQAVAHLPVHFDSLQVDAYACSGYKFGSSTGTGVLMLSKRLQTLKPAFLGGGMVDVVSPDGSEFKDYPTGWEAGTPNVDGLLTLPTAYRGWFERVDFQAHEHALRQTLVDGLRQMPGINLLGEHLTSEKSIGVVSFVSSRWHAHDLGTLLGERRFAVRVGHHCAQRLFSETPYSSSVRVSFGPYNTLDQVRAFLVALRDIEAMT
jgi:selenocysteine lyase/cysteine desulfurase